MNAVPARTTWIVVADAARAFLVQADHGPVLDCALDVDLVRDRRLARAHLVGELPLGAPSTGLIARG